MRFTFVKHGAGAIAALTASVVAATATPALAHARRDVAGVQWVVGWSGEPAFAGQLNSVEVILSRGEQPVEGAKLKVELSLGDETSDELDLEPAFGEPGRYEAAVIPTTPGDYTFHFTGTVADQKVDESFTGSKDGFDEPKGTETVAFPDPAPTSTQLARRAETIEREVTAARNSARLPLILAIVALVLGLVALVRPRRA